MAPDIITNSWTCPTYEGCEPDTLRTAVEAQQAAGILVVASAGNDGPACSSVAEPPAIYEAAYVVGALQTGTDTIAAFSGRGPVDVDGSNRSKPDMSAPGTVVRSAVNGGGYSSFSGTSMAAPHVAGAAALLWSAAPDLRGDISATRQALNAAAVPIASSACGSDSVPNNTYGHGRLDIYAAVRQAVDIQPPAYTYLPVVQAAP
jgi:subtilisin family serine protease